MTAIGVRTRVRCVYSGWSRHGNTLACREAFGSPAAVAKHVANVGGSVEALKAGAGATLTGTLFHSSQLNIESYRSNMKRQGVFGEEPPLFFYKGSAAERGQDGGFSSFELQQSMFGFSF